MYTRRGPTYDARSLQEPSSPVQPPSTEQSSPAWPSEKPQSVFAFAFGRGRGRGRGRGAVPSQPLRRPGAIQQQQQQAKSESVIGF